MAKRNAADGTWMEMATCSVQWLFLPACGVCRVIEGGLLRGNDLYVLTCDDDLIDISAVLPFVLPVASKGPSHFEGGD